MPRDGNTDMGGERRSFPSTHWSQLAAVRDAVTEEHRAILNSLIEAYWKPVYWYIRRRGRSNEDAKDLAQEFFTACLGRELFGRADRGKGRFRSFLLSCLQWNLDESAITYALCWVNWSHTPNMRRLSKR